MREAKLVSKNGINVYAYKNPALHGFQISLFLKAGALYGEGEYPGITHFFEHIAIRNVNKIMDMGLYRALDSRGLEFNAATYSEMVQFYIVGASEHFSFAKDVIIKLFSPITLSRAEIEAERKRIKAEIRESDDKNTLSSFTSGIAFADTSLSGSIVGTNSSVDKINAKRLEEYRRANMNAGSVFFYVTGNVSDGDLAELVRAAGELELPPAVPRDNIAPVPERFGKRENRVYVKSADFTMVRFTFDLDMSELSVPETDVIYDTLLGGYSSRMFIEMSEKRGLFYDISGGVNNALDAVGVAYNGKSLDKGSGIGVDRLRYPISVAVIVSVSPVALDKKNAV